MNQPGKTKSAVVLDEFSTLTFLELSIQIASSRIHLISTILAMQSDHQLRLQSGKKWADVVPNICGNIMIGQTSEELAKQVSERLGKTMQDRESISINSGDTSFSKSKQLEMAVQASTISYLSAGEFLRITADTPELLIELKRFHAHLKIDNNASKIEKEPYLPIPVVKPVIRKDIMDNYAIIKQDVLDIVEAVLQSVLNDPSQEGSILKK